MELKLQVLVFVAGTWTRTNNKLNPHIMLGPGIKFKLHWWKLRAQQKCAVYNISRLVSFLLRVTEVFCMEYTTHKMLACFKVFCSVNHSQLEGNEVFDRKVDRLKRCVNPWFMFSWNFRIQKIIHKNTILLRKMYHKRTTLKMVTPLICIRLNILTSEGHK